MEQKTKINAEDGRQEVHITREFDLPVELLFKAFAEAEFVEQWMGTKVLKMESKKHGSYELETTDPKGNRYGFHGTIHDFSQNKKITRTFEIENAPLGVQLEILEFEGLTDNTSKLNMHVVYESIAQRDQVLKMGMTQGINMAHNRLQEIMNEIK